MELLKELFASPVGILSFITIAFVIVIATFCIFLGEKTSRPSPEKLIYLLYLFPLDVCVFRV